MRRPASDAAPPKQKWRLDLRSEDEVLALEPEKPDALRFRRRRFITAVGVSSLLLVVAFVSVRGASDEGPVSGIGGDGTSAIGASADHWVPVRVRGRIEQHEDGRRLCPGGVAPCWVIVGGAGVQSGDVMVEGEWQDDRIRLTGESTPPPPPAVSADFPNPCPDAIGMGGENGDQSVLERATAYGQQHPDQFAGLWLARPGPVVVIAFTGEGERHRASLDDPSICVTDDGFRYPQAELEHVQQEIGASGLPMNGSSLETVENVVAVAFDVVDQRLREEIEARWGDRVRIDAIIEVMTGDLHQLEREPSSEEIPVLAGRRGAGSMAALGRFVLRYDLDGDCLYLEANDERITPVWRYGSKGLREPVRVVNGEGEVIVRVNESFETGGGFTLKLDQKDPLSCGGTQTFVM